VTLKLYAHPFSSYCQKALIAFYENAIPFEMAVLETGSAASEEVSRLWPLKRFPVLEDGGRVVPEATIIIEYLAVHYPGSVRLVPEDAAAAIDVRLMDRFFDNYVMNAQGNIVFDFIRPQGQQDAYGVAQSRTMLDRAYRWLDDHMAKRTWAAGEAFSLADCAAAPALLYADWTYPRSRRNSPTSTPIARAFCSAHPMRAPSTKRGPIVIIFRWARQPTAIERSAKAARASGSASSRRHLVEFRQSRIEMIPGVAAIAI
jgi:glutathione S-transferase